ncbi:MAG: trypsin-like peptidase domain-containing protein, partial [Taibaiella sp.]|nr:trypsin-like peptidase domain-containing protein [Taibaiella sp.]
MNNNNVMEIAEAWLAGTLPPAEKAAVKSRMDADPAFAIEFNESLNLISSLESFGKSKKFRGTLTDIQQQQQSKKGLWDKIRTIELPSYFWRTAAVAAGVALLTSVVNYSFFVNTASRNASQYNTISREVEHIKVVQKKQQEQQNAIIDSIKKKNLNLAPPSEVRYTGTGFALTNDGYFVTAYHVINDGHGDCDSVYIQSNDGIYYKASLVNFNSKTDLAILKVEKKNFRFAKAEVPYTFATAKTGLGSGIYTLGYPKNDIVYSEGYVSARNGYDGNERQYTLELPAGHGQSGSPVLDSKGNVMGMLTAISGVNEANTYAVSSGAL